MSPEGMSPVWGMPRMLPFRLPGPIVSTRLGRVLTGVYAQQAQTLGWRGFARVVVDVVAETGLDH